MAKNPGKPTTSKARKALQILSPITSLTKKPQPSKGMVNYEDRNRADFFDGTDEQRVKLPRYEPDQLELIKSIMATLQGNPNVQGMASNLALPGNNQLSFDPIRQNAYDDYKKRIVPTISERFQSLGGGATSSPALHQQLIAGGNNVQNQLAALESQYNLQKSGLESDNYKSLANIGLGQRNDIGTIPAQDSGWNTILKALLSGGAAYGAASFGGTPGAVGALAALNGLSGNKGGGMSIQSASGQPSAGQSGTGYNIGNGLGQESMPSMRNSGGEQGQNIMDMLGGGNSQQLNRQPSIGQSINAGQNQGYTAGFNPLQSPSGYIQPSSNSNYSFNNSNQFLNDILANLFQGR